MRHRVKKAYFAVGVRITSDTTTTQSVADSKWVLEIQAPGHKHLTQVNQFLGLSGKCALEEVKYVEAFITSELGFLRLSPSSCSLS